MITIRGPNKGGVVVTEVLSSKQSRTVSEYDVVFGEAFLCSRGRGYEEDGARTELKEEDWTILV